MTLLPDGELEGVDLAEPLLVGQGGDVLAQTLEGVVDALHPPPLPHVGSVPHVNLVRDLLLLPALSLSHLEVRLFFVKLRQGSGKVRQGKARKGKDGER